MTWTARTAGGLGAAARRARGALVLAVVLGAGCGYAFTQRYTARGGATRVHVRTFENLSSDPELGATVTAALRQELARRGADGGEGAPAHIEGVIAAGEPVPASEGARTWRVAVEIRARLIEGSQAAVESTIRRDGEYLAGAENDPLETEARRALALRRVASDAAREVLRAFER
jgi:hypothetical protein